MFPECEEKIKLAAERIKVLEIVHKRVVNRFNRLYLYLGMNIDQAKEQKVFLYSYVSKSACNTSNNNVTYRSKGLNIASKNFCMHCALWPIAAGIFFC